MKPLAYDLFCGAGGATRGLQLAGYYVVGVDIRPQPRYCGDEFIRNDAVRFLDHLPRPRASIIWASPPCQRWSAPAQQRGTAESHPDLIEPIRDRLREWAATSGGLYCIENVPRAPLYTTLVLTGCMFGLSTYRKRKFETNFIVLAPQPGRAFGPKTRKDAVTVAGSSGGKSNRDHWQNGRKDAWQVAMGIDWMTNEEMAQAVPPAYAEYIGRAALAQAGSKRHG